MLPRYAERHAFSARAITPRCCRDRQRAMRRFSPLLRCAIFDYSDDDIMLMLLMRDAAAIFAERHSRQPLRLRFRQFVAAISLSHYAFASRQLFPPLPPLPLSPRYAAIAIFRYYYIATIIIFADAAFIAAF